MEFCPVVWNMTIITMCIVGLCVGKGCMPYFFLPFVDLVFFFTGLWAWIHRFSVFLFPWPDLEYIFSLSTGYIVAEYWNSAAVCGIDLVYNMHSLWKSLAAKKMWLLFWIGLSAKKIFVIKLFDVQRFVTNGSIIIMY